MPPENAMNMTLFVLQEIKSAVGKTCHKYQYCNLFVATKLCSWVVNNKSVGKSVCVNIFVTRCKGSILGLISQNII